MIFLGFKKVLKGRNFGNAGRKRFLYGSEIQIRL